MVVTGAMLPSSSTTSSPTIFHPEKTEKAKARERESKQNWRDDSERKGSEQASELQSYNIRTAQYHRSFFIDTPIIFSFHSFPSFYSIHLDYCFCTSLSSSTFLSFSIHPFIPPTHSLLLCLCMSLSLLLCVRACIIFTNGWIDR